MASSKQETKKKNEARMTETIVNYDIPVKPEDQLILSHDILEEEYDNMFYIKEPPKPYTHSVYSYRKAKFVPDINKSYGIPLIVLKPALLHRESTEAAIQIENELCRMPENITADDKLNMTEMMEEEQTQDFMLNIEEDVNEEGMEEHEEDNEEFSNVENEMDEMDEAEVEKSLAAASKDVFEPVLKKRVLKEESMVSFISLPVTKSCVVIKLKNVFNFVDRYAQTKSISTHDKDTQTIIKKSMKFQKNVSRSQSYDVCKKDFKKQQDEKEEEMRKKMAAHMSKKHAGSKKKQVMHDPKALGLLNISKTTEREVNLNVSDAIAQDFRYYEDPSDQFRKKGEGTLMLMWTMVFKKDKVFIVTDMCWNPIYFDMIAITISIPQSYLSKTDLEDVGYVCIWSLKNSAYPDFVIETEHGAICLSFHHLGYNLVVGFRNGGLAVYNINLLTKEPQYKTDLAQTRHMDCVRQVVWGKDLPNGEMNFFSVSEDGTVCQWLLVEFEMLKIVIMSLIIEMDPEIELGGIKQTYYAMGTTITFNPGNDELYLIGTTEGYVYKCNTAWSRCPQKFRAHEMAVNQIEYNKFDYNIFMTCSDDFTVKIWEDNAETPVITLNLLRALCDVRWSPFSSTVFAILTVDCRILFYDVDVSVKNTVCNQLIQSEEEFRPTKMIFDKRVPLVLVGSSKSTVITFKLSPGLRTTIKPPKKGVQISVETLELEKLHAVLDSLREKPLSQSDTI